MTKLTNKYVLPGNPCHNWAGYCDALGTCQMIDMDGPLKTILTTFFTYAGKGRDFISIY